MAFLLWAIVLWNQGCETQKNPDMGNAAEVLKTRGRPALIGKAAKIHGQQLDLIAPRKCAAQMTEKEMRGRAWVYCPQRVVATASFLSDMRKGVIDVGDPKALLQVGMGSVPLTHRAEVTIIVIGQDGKVSSNETKSIDEIDVKEPAAAKK